MRATLLLTLSAPILAACSERTLVVESDTAWNGGIFGPGGSQFEEGSGGARYDLSGARHCWLFEKETAGGVLRVYVESTSIAGPSRVSESSTVEPFGVVDACG